MAVLNFPVNPTDGDVYTANGQTYTYNASSTSWEIDAAVGYTGSQGFTGSKGAGYTGSRGDLGYTGSIGDIGFTGSQGVGFTGSSTATGLRYRYDTGTNTSTPATGEFRFDNASPGSAGMIGINATDLDSVATNGFFTGLDNYGSSNNVGTMLIREADANGTEYLAFTVASTFVFSSGVLQADIANVTGSLSIADGTECVILFFPAVKGDIGFSGSKGDIGYTGSRGEVGFTGSQGNVGFDGSKGDIGFVGSRGNAGVNGTGGGFFVLEGERNGSVNLNQYFAIGNGAQPTQGVRVPIDCNLEYLTLSSDGLQTMTVTLYINGSASTATVALAGQGSNTATINPALSISAGDRITFRCTAGSSSNTTIAAAWFAHDGVKGYTGSKGDTGFTGSAGTDGTSVTVAGSIADVNVNPPNNPQTTLNNNFGSASAGDGVVDQATGNLWVYDGATWNNVGQFVGYTGSQGVGFTGSKGDTGFTGSIGGTGFAGSVGFTGSKGDIGFTGSKGDTGFNGSKGDTGFTGSRGDTGFTGSIGGTGFTGSKGDTGFTGSKGDTGFNGSQGFGGSVGFTGSAGAAGGGAGLAIAMAIVFG